MPSTRPADELLADALAQIEAAVKAKEADVRRLLGDELGRMTTERSRLNSLPELARGYGIGLDADRVTDEVLLGIRLAAAMVADSQFDY